jgi:dolichyl-phosphate beta-glucosyltransferase
MSDPTVSYVIPVHNQIADLRRTVRLLVERLGHLPGSEILLVENGSSDGSGPLCLSLAALLDSEEVAVRVTTSAKGLGFAWRRGMALARGEVLVLTAADLPFGFTDLDGYLGMSPRPLFVMGSKTHPDSQVETSFTRRALSAGFGVLRTGLLGVNVDTQGTVLMQRSLASAVLPRLVSGDFLIGAEINCWAARMGVTPIEIPVVYTASGRSTVSPLRDSTRMAAGLFALRRRLADDGRATQGVREVATS